MARMLWSGRTRQRAGKARGSKAMAGPRHAPWDCSSPLPHGGTTGLPLWAVPLARAPTAKGWAMQRAPCPATQWTGCRPPSPTVDPLRDPGTSGEVRERWSHSPSGWSLCPSPCPYSPLSLPSPRPCSSLPVMRTGSPHHRIPPPLPPRDPPRCCRPMGHRRPGPPLH